MDVTTLPAWRALARHRAAMATTIAELFELESDRLTRRTLSGGGLTLDVSRSLASTETFEHLYTLADSVNFEEQRKALFRGEHVNASEDRAALHMLLRTLRPAEHPAAVAVRDTIARI